jgi:hypothetical protein
MRHFTTHFLNLGGQTLSLKLKRLRSSGSFLPPRPLIVLLWLIEQIHLKEEHCLFKLNFNLELKSATVNHHQ